MGRMLGTGHDATVTHFTVAATAATAGGTVALVIG